MADEVLKQFTITRDGMEVIAKKLTASFVEGLSREDHSSSVKMFVTFVHSLPDRSEVGEYLALDLGGTNFRVLKIIINPDGTISQEPFEEKLTKEQITTTQEVLFDHIADCVQRFIAKHNISSSLPLGFTFSFPVRQVGLTSGYLVRWTKDFTASGAVGKDVVQLLLAAFERKKLENVEVVALVNDTTGTQMALGWKDSDTYIGLILGTGTNACYLESMDKVLKYPGTDKDKHSHVIINCEWGAFGEKGEIDDFLTEVDRKLDEGAENKKEQLYEKMISGKYLGEMVRLLCLELVSKKLLFGGEAPELFKQRGTFESTYLSDIETGDNADVAKIKNLLNTKLGVVNATDEDCQLLRKACEAVSRRAARLAAAGVVALARKINKVPNCTVAVDGSLYRKHPHFAKRMDEAVTEMESNHGITFKISEDGSGRGAAMVAAVANRLKKQSTK